MINLNISVTSMEHRQLSVLNSAPFDDIYTEDYQGDVQYYSFDAFHRHYNDAVELSVLYKYPFSSITKYVTTIHVTQPHFHLDH